MNPGLYAIYDNVAKEIVSDVILIHKHVASAIRTFGESLSNPKSRLAQNPKDFDLIQVGEVIYDDLAGADTRLPQVKPLDHSELVMAGAAWLATQHRSENLKLEA